MATVLIKEKENVTTTAQSVVSDSDSNIAISVAPLGVPREEKRFFFQRTKGNYDPNAIATQPSVFDDPETAAKYQPRSDWENLVNFDPSFRWTWAEESRVIRKTDFRICLWACIMFIALEMDRSNISNALTDNFLGDLGLTTNDYNFGNSVFKLAFLCAELPSQLVSKWLGPDRWIPIQMVLWSFVSVSQFWLTGRQTFLLTRALLGILQGGFIPDVILYLSYFYKHHELSIRLGFFWTALTIADILSALMAYGLLHMRGVDGQAGWRWMFLVEGLLTFVVGILSFLLMPPGPSQTASWFRGRKGWYNEREQKIIVNRVIREDPSKSSMHNRQPITPWTLWQSLKDFDLWPLYIIGMIFQIPQTPESQYLTLTLKGLGFNTFQSNLLTIPSSVLHMIFMLILTYVAEIWQELTITALFGQIWTLPFLIWLATSFETTTNKWLVFTMVTLLLAYPNAHPIQVAWNSRNSNAVRLRTVSAACYNMFVQAGGIIASNIYRTDDAPLYRRGNKDLLAILAMNIVIYLLTKAYYVFRNNQKQKKWDALTKEEKLDYLSNTTDQGNKRLDFRFQH